MELVTGAGIFCLPYGCVQCCDRLTSLGRDLHVKMHPFQALQCPADGLDLGRFGKTAQDRNDTLWCVPLVVELMIAADTFHLLCGFMV